MELVMLLLLFAVVILFIAVVRRSTNKRAPTTMMQKTGDPAVAHRALVGNADTFSNRPTTLFPTSLAIGGPGGQRTDNVGSVVYGPHWRALRCNLTAGTLHPSRIGLLAPRQREAVEAVVADLSACAGEVVPVRSHLYKAVFPAVARLCFGDDVDEGQVRGLERVLHEFLVAVDEAASWPTTTLSKLVHWRRWSRFHATLGRQAGFYLPLVAARRNSTRRVHDGGSGIRPYVDSLIELRVPCSSSGGGGGGRELRDDEMVSLVSEFLGSATTGVVLCLEWTLAHLVDQPEVQKKLRREIIEIDAGGDKSSSLRKGMPYLHAVVLESLRLHPPVPILPRQVHFDSPPVLFVVGDVGRDSKTWTDPHHFLPERFLPGGEAEGVGPMPGPKEIRMMPFGTGHRFCPGVGLAMASVKLFLATLVSDLEWLPAGAVDMTEVDLLFKMMKNPLLARVKPLVPVQAYKMD